MIDRHTSDESGFLCFVSIRQQVIESITKQMFSTAKTCVDPKIVDRISVPGVYENSRILNRFY